MTTKEIDVSFDDRFIDWILSGRKRSTIRLNKLGNRGDVFTVGDKRFKITDVEQAPLIDFYYFNIWKDEGFATCEELIEVLQEFYPEIDILESEVWCHIFTPVDPAEVPK